MFIITLGNKKKCLGKGRCCKDARRVHRALSKKRWQTRASLLHEIDSSLVLAKGFLLKQGWLTNKLKT